MKSLASLFMPFLFLKLLREVKAVHNFFHRQDGTYTPKRKICFDNFDVPFIFSKVHILEKFL